MRTTTGFESSRAARAAAATASSGAPRAFAGLRVLRVVVLIASLLTAGTAHAEPEDFEFFTSYGRQFKTRPVVAALMFPLMVITTPFWFGGYLVTVASGDGEDAEEDDD